VALPVLRSANPSDRGVEVQGVAGLPDTMVAIRRYELYGADGALLASFDKHEIDEARHRIVVQPTAPTSALRLFPFDTKQGPDGVPRTAGATIAGFDDGVVRTFDIESGVLVAEQYANERVEYAYNGHLLPTEIRITAGKGPARKAVEFRHDQSGSLVVTALDAAHGKSVNLAPARKTSLPEVFGNVPVAPAEVAAAELDQKDAPVLLPLGGYTMLFNHGGGTALGGSIRSPSALLLQARERVGAAGGAEIVDIESLDATTATMFARSGGEYYLDELSDTAPRRRLKGAAALDAYQAVLAKRVATAALSGHHFVFWARQGKVLRVWSGDTIVDLPSTSLDAPTGEQLAAILGSARGPVFLLHQGIELAPETAELASALLMHARSAKRQVYLARDLERALHNYRRLGETRKASDVSVSVFDNFQSARYLRLTAQALEGRGARHVLPEAVGIEAGLRGNDGARPTLVLYAHNDDTFTHWLEDAGSKGKLTNRSVLLITCDSKSNASRLSALLASSGAVAFTNVLGSVDPTVLDAVTAELGPLLDRLGTHPASGDSLVREAIERAMQSPSNVTNQQLIVQLRALLARLFLQLSLAPTQVKVGHG